MLKRALLGLVALAAWSGVAFGSEKRLADESFLKNQKAVLDLFVGFSLRDHIVFSHDHSDFDFLSNSNLWTDPEVPRKFVHEYNQGFLPKHSVYSSTCPYVRRQTRLLFDLFFFAKDFDTFFKAACWAKNHVNPITFINSYMTALLQRDDCHGFLIPPGYEVMPNFFVPQETMHEAYDFKMRSMKEGHFVFNNTGYDYDYHAKAFHEGEDWNYPHLEHKISYFTEDVGANVANGEFHYRFPTFIRDEKYNKTQNGAFFLHYHERLNARYNLERIANSLPRVDPLSWTKPIRAGYNPRVIAFNGRALVPRPDHYNPSMAPSLALIERSKEIEQRLSQVIDYGSLWLEEPKLTPLINERGLEVLGQIMNGIKKVPYFGNYFWVTLNALSQMTKTQDDTSNIGGIINKPYGSMRDPAFYSFLHRYLHWVEKLKAKLPAHQQKDLLFPGVKVHSLQVDKLLTYFEMFNFEITQGVAAKDIADFVETRYTASQYRLNHKPFTFNITIESDDTHEAMVRLFIGPERDSEGRLMTLEQKRHAMFELDRFSTKLVAGQNVLERHSYESPFFGGEREGYRSLYKHVNAALEGRDKFYIYQKSPMCGLPYNLQLPKGKHSGAPFTFAVLVTKWDKKFDSIKVPCVNSKWIDGKPFGFPFDRPIVEYSFRVPNFYMTSMPIYHKYDDEIKRHEKH